jgi:hypothetical protein
VTVPPRVDVLVCEGRVCTGNGAVSIAGAVTAALVDRAGGMAPDDAAVVHPAVHPTVGRGGCYGLCDLGPNVVIRRAGTDAASTEVDADRLTLRGGPDEDVAVAITLADVAALVDGVVVDGRAPAHLLRSVREPTIAPRTPVEARLRALRALRAARRAAAGTAVGAPDEGGQDGP